MKEWSLASNPLTGAEAAISDMGAFRRAMPVGYLPGAKTAPSFPGRSKRQKSAGDENKGRAASQNRPAPRSSFKATPGPSKNLATGVPIRPNHLISPERIAGIDSCPPGAIDGEASANARIPPPSVRRNRFSPIFSPGCYVIRRGYRADRPTASRPLRETVGPWARLVSAFSGKDLGCCAFGMGFSWP